MKYFQTKKENVKTPLESFVNMMLPVTSPMLYHNIMINQDSTNSLLDIDFFSKHRELTSVAFAVANTGTYASIVYAIYNAFK
ncbi:MAG: hypothetical protein WC916_01615 [Candidatus Woesearchaeota archaeon]